MNVTIDSLAWSIQFASCFYMTGVILLIQLIHYPGFAQIDRNQFSQFHQKHSAALGLIAGPVMCTEIVTAAWLAMSGNLWLITNALLVGVLWIITFFMSVPAHNRLAQGFEEDSWRRLVRTNWLRTIIWISRSAVFILLLCQSLKIELQ